MPGLTILGPIASTVREPSPNPVEQGAEEYGMFVLGDANDVHQYSGMELGTRWLCRLQGPVLEIVRNWPTPNSETWRYHPSEEAARQMYVQLRQHIFATFPGVEARDERGNAPLNVPTAHSESFWQNGSMILHLFYDNMTDLQVAVRNTNCIRRFNAHPATPDGPGLVTYFTQGDVQTLAIAKNERGVAEHIVIAFSPKRDGAELLAQGMPRAEKRPNHEQKPLMLTSGFLVAFWGRASGPAVMAPTRGQHPAPMLHQYLGSNVAAPLATNVPGLDPRLPAPAAYAIRVEPGLYDVLYYELDANAEGGHSFVALSKQGAPPFQPLTVGNAGGIRIGGMTLEEYAMMTCERERALMQQGANAGQALAMICQKYNQPVPKNALGVDTGYAARILDWDKKIHSDPKMTAQFMAAKGVAQLRLQGIEPSQEQMAQLAGQQQAIQQQLQSANKANQDANKQLFDGACQIIEMARTRTPEQLIAEARNIFSIETQRAGTPAYGFYKAVQIIKQPGYQGNPKFLRINEVAEKLAQAHYRCMRPEDQKSEGSEKAYVKDVIATAYEKNGLPVPGVGGFLNRFMDKL
jgi:hypothetical protein